MDADITEPRSNNPRERQPNSAPVTSFRKAASEDKETESAEQSAAQRIVDELAVPLAAEMIALQQPKAVIRAECERILKTKIGDRWLSYIMTEGRKVLLAALELDEDENKAHSVGTYNAIIRDPNSKPADIVTAQSRKDKILGVGERQKPLNRRSVAAFMESLEDTVEDAPEPDDNP